jgi:hypothetical protein
MEAAIQARIDAAFAFARSAPFPAALMPAEAAR